MYNIERNVWVRLEQKEEPEAIYVMCSLGDWVYAIDIYSVKRIDASAMLRGEKREWQDHYNFVKLNFD